jgi:hypothetical protein
MRLENPNYQKTLPHTAFRAEGANLKKRVSLETFDFNCTVLWGKRMSLQENTPKGLRSLKDKLSLWRFKMSSFTNTCEIEVIDVLS